MIHQDSARIWVVRHASTASTPRRRLLGTLNEPLSDEGLHEATLFAKGLVAFRRATGLADAPGMIVSSPLTRAQMTASVLAGTLGWQLQEVSAFAERHFGRWSGRRLDDLLVHDPRDVARFVADPLSIDPPEAETGTALRDRVLSGWTDMITLSRCDHEVVIVTHDGPLRVLLHELGYSGIVKRTPLYRIKPCHCFCVYPDSRTAVQLDLPLC